MAYKVGYFVGSLSSTSINRELSKALIRLAPDDLEFSEIAIDKLPLYSQDYDAAFPPEAQALKQAISEADAILFVSPEYNRSIPGALKNAIDWASRPRDEAALRHKPAAVVGASTGLFGAVWAQAETRKSLAIAGAKVLEQEFPLGEADIAFGDDGLLAEPELNERLAEIVGALTEHTAELAAA
jgi:chromate reductase, NAD(P)H dehydrogenase (quinone)